jgi:uncharacterized protein YutE (UPF0331/DUF86 family)
MTPQGHEVAILERIQANLNAEGYRVVLRPDRYNLPDFLQDLRPDAVAFGERGNLVVEVVSRSNNTDQKLQRFRNALNGQPDWKLHTVWTSGHTVPPSPKPMSRKSVQSSLRQITNLLESGFIQPAFLLCWATLEAVGRRLLPSELEKPQSPARLVEYLAAQGHLSRTEVSTLKSWAQTRNKLVHGDLDLEVSELETRKFSEIITRVNSLSS